MSYRVPQRIDRADLFQGTAGYYLKYRPRYPDALLADLAAQFDLNEDSRVVDLGCGPGFLAIPLAAYCGRIIAVDPQPEMIAVAKAAAAEAGRGNITWVEGSAEDLGPDIAPLRCATLGRSFHWMRREAVLRLLDQVIDPQGAVVLVEERRPQVTWRRTLRDFILQWHGGSSPSHVHHVVRTSGVRHDEVLLSSAFNRIDKRSYPVERRWTVDSIVGYAYSTSSAAPGLLGEGRAAFEAGLRDALNALPGAPDFAERVEVTAIIASRQGR